MEVRPSWANDMIVKQRLEPKVVELGRWYYVLFTQFGHLPRVGKWDCVWAGVHGLGTCDQMKSEPEKTCDKRTTGW